ncbi:MAG: EpsI family protein [Alphaproteobacteria bacterium]|nr:EpsI family protein [Alphaproteobacteria bacterium]
MSIVARVAVAVGLLATAGTIRLYQESRVRALADQARISPFPLESLPRNLGPWRGEDTQLDPRIARATGATDRLYRRYVDSRTGTTLEVIVLYGPPAAMFIHAPENCYPSAGYLAVDGPAGRRIPTSERNATFRALVYAKGEGASAERQEVLYAWLLGGRWALDLGVFKQVERIAGMYKVHVGRRVTDRERTSADLPAQAKTGQGGDAAPFEDDSANPSEAFLALLVPELEKRVAAVGRP